MSFVEPVTAASAKMVLVNLVPIPATVDPTR